MTLNCWPLHHFCTTYWRTISGPIFLLFVFHFLKLIAEMVQQDFNFRCSFEDSVAIHDNALPFDFNRHYRPVWQGLQCVGCKWVKESAPLSGHFAAVRRAKAVQQFLWSVISYKQCSVPQIWINLVQDWHRPNKWLWTHTQWSITVYVL